MRRHSMLDERSLAMDRIIADRIAANPQLLKRVGTILSRWTESASTAVLPDLLEWQRLLEGPLDDLLQQLRATDERAVQLRQSSPFCGILTPEERTRLLLEYHHRDQISA